MAEDADRDRIREEIAKALPTGVGVKAPAQDNQMADQTIRSAELGLTLATAFALMIAVFTIFNTFKWWLGSVVGSGDLASNRRDPQAD